MTLALKNLGRRKIRTSLTVLGIAIAIAFAFVLFSVSEGTQEMMTGAEKLVPNIEVENQLQLARLDESWATILAEINGVRKATPVTLYPIVLGQQGYVFILGMKPSDVLDLYSGLVEIADGRALTDDDNFAIVLGYQVSKENALRVGDNLRIGSTSFEVVGIIAKTGGILDMIGVMPLKISQSILGIENKVSSIWLWVENREVKAVIGEIENKYPDVKATESVEFLEQSEKFMQFSDAIRLIVAGIAVLIGALAAMNTVTMSTLERTRELGAMRSLGASSGYVFRLVLIESTLLCAIGGMLGCLLGYAGSIAIESVIVNMIGMDVVAITLRVPLITIGIAIAVGLVAGIYPAWRISRQQIVEALKYE